MYSCNQLEICTQMHPQKHTKVKLWPKCIKDHFASAITMASLQFLMGKITHTYIFRVTGIYIHYSDYFGGQTNNRHSNKNDIFE